MNEESRMTENVQGLITDLSVAISNCSLYSREHPSVERLCQKALRAMEGLYAGDALSFTILADGLVVNDLPVRRESLHVSNLIKRMRRKGIEQAVLRRGVAAGELKTFIASLVSPGRRPASSPHIAVGAVEVGLKAEGAADVQGAVGENVSRVREAFHGMSRFRKLDIVGLEDVVMSFLSTIKREANILRVISPVKSYSEYTYTHATNVTVISMFQAENLGLEGEVLYDLGLAGLLHDVGKMFISKDILEKDARLSSEEWEEMKRHPVYGASYLATLQEMPKLAVVAAFEHHMKFDGSGYPETWRGRQHLISQIIAISDFFDALRTERPYRGALELTVILGLIKESAGKDFNPLLAENFLTAVERVRAS